ncbi:RNA polymerase sigma factor sigd chloroplastic [Phtheirospermum japonicum]|uniref:RNA polymerase sigma factor sigd chloroplastic n=1 Tax=Phtheirospermum japonicum TaxID=374723 RepID=A0A830BY55_9LAMI|nr:RNA polymerase sigma factor sigd chloroplastic [Phtheirospermum japonicum]
MAICSCSNQYSPSFPSISLSSHYNTDSSHLKLPTHVSLIHSSSNYTTSTSIHEDPFALHQILDRDEKNEQYWWNEVKFRRNKRRRKIKSASEYKRTDEDDKLVFVDRNEGKSRFMTPKEEATFSWYLKERARIEAVRTELQVNMGSAKELSPSQWAKAAKISQHNLDKILCNGRESEDRITRSYHRLVVHVASSYIGRGLSLQDLTQEGNIGLLRGAIKFDPERGYKLSTYAYWWIRQSISKAIANKSKIIRLPGSISELVPKICEANAVLSRKLQRIPTYDEIAEAIDASPRAVRLAIERNKPLISIDQAITSHGCMSLQDIIGGPDEMTPEVMVKKEMLRPEIRKLLEALREREAHILRLRYGLDGDAAWSFEEIGRLLSISRERVRQINTGALAKLRRVNQIDDLKHFIHT